MSNVLYRKRMSICWQHDFYFSWGSQYGLSSTYRTWKLIKIYCLFVFTFYYKRNFGNLQSWAYSFCSKFYFYQSVYSWLCIILMFYLVLNRTGIWYTIFFYNSCTLYTTPIKLTATDIFMFKMQFAERKKSVFFCVVLGTLDKPISN